MSEQRSDSGRDTIDVHNRLDKVVLTTTAHDAGTVSTNLTPTDARQLAQALRDAADAAERTPGS